MKKRIIIGVLTLLFIISLLVSMYFILISEIPLFMVSFVICTILFIITVNFISTNKTEAEQFDKDIDNIVKKNKRKLIRTYNYPDLLDKKIIKVDNLEELFNKSKETNTRIHYIKTIYTCSFILTIDNDSYVYIIKRKDDDISALEIIIKDIENMKD